MIFTEIHAEQVTVEREVRNSIVCSFAESSFRAPGSVARQADRRARAEAAQRQGTRRCLSRLPRAHCTVVRIQGENSNNELKVNEAGRVHEPTEAEKAVKDIVTEFSVNFGNGVTRKCVKPTTAVCCCLLLCFAVRDFWSSGTRTCSLRLQFDLAMRCC